MSKLNVVRQIKQKTRPAFSNNLNPENDKEIRWNNRFHLGKLPDYNSHQDSNCKKTNYMKIYQNIFIKVNFNKIFTN
jgi:hypothetical protein